ncbi:hypothetical protein [Cylindrospermopsis raciborskii]|uniref:hypothetical protein n=1 Tax=Cylindrospermopsis raciborskii TaxID=77022 RepID=UPI001454DF25|nr:hypothetical protein [Cylindrospermopsis raciborskii]
MLRKRNLLILLKGKTERGEKAIAILENENVGRIVLTGFVKFYVKKDVGNG